MNDRHRLAEYHLQTSLGFATKVRTANLFPGSLPEHLMSHESVWLNWDTTYDEFTVSLTGVTGTLRFNGEPYRCVIPWSEVDFVTKLIVVKNPSPSLRVFVNHAVKRSPRRGKLSLVESKG